MSELIVERMDFESVENKIVTESIGEGKTTKKYYVYGPSLVSEVKNANGRIYPKPIIEREVDKMNKTLIPQCSFYGELNHPDSIEINPERITHMTKELRMEGNIAISKSLVMDTPLGKIVKTIFDEGGKLGISSRGVGTLKESIVQSDFALSALDIVSSPSGPNCILSSIYENKEWVFENGLLTEKEREKIIKEVDRAIVECKFSIDDKRAAFLKLFQKTLATIGNKIK